MRWVTLSHFAKLFLLLALLAGMQISIAPTASLAAETVAQPDGSAIANQCHHCDKTAAVAAKCGVVCAPACAIYPDSAAVFPLEAPPLRPLCVAAAFGRIMCPDPAPPRLPKT